MQVFDIPHELPEHRADGREIRPLLKSDDGEVATCMLNWVWTVVNGRDSYVHVVVEVEVYLAYIAYRICFCVNSEGKG